jgi:hypothetical protein
MPANATSARKKPSTAKRKAAPKAGAYKEPAALKRLNKSLDNAQEALAALRKDVSKDVGSGAKDLYTDVERFVKTARRDGSKLGRALERDMRKAGRKLSPAKRSTAKRSTAKR